MKLLKHIKKIAPINNELDIQNLLKLMSSRCARIGTYQENLLLFYTVPELHEFLRNCIRTYRKYTPKKHIRLDDNRKVKVYRSDSKEEEDSSGISKNGLTQADPRTLNMFTFRTENKNNSLSKKGYEYGLSDW